MPQLDLPAYPTQLFWLTCLLTLSYWVLHLIAIPSILITLRVRNRSLSVIKTTMEKSYKMLQLNKTKFYTLLANKIKTINMLCIRIRKVILSFLNYQQASLNQYTILMRLILNEPTALSEKQVEDDYELEFEFPDNEDDELAYILEDMGWIKTKPVLYEVARRIRKKTLFEIKAPKKKSWFTKTKEYIKSFFNLSLPFIPVIHPYDDFLLATAFTCVFIFILRKYGTALAVFMTNSYAQEIKAKFVQALTDVSLNLNLAKLLLSNYNNVVINIRNTYLSMLKNFLIQNKYPVKLKSLEEENNS
jgi:hypothetical protein